MAKYKLTKAKVYKAGKGETFVKGKVYELTDKQFGSIPEEDRRLFEAVKEVKDNQASGDTENKGKAKTGK